MLLVMSDYQEMIIALLSVWGGESRCELVCAICIMACGCVGIEHIMTVDGNGEGQARSSCTMDWEQVKGGREGLD